MSVALLMGVHVGLPYTSQTELHEDSQRIEALDLDFILVSNHQRVACAEVEGTSHRIEMTAAARHGSSLTRRCGTGAFSQRLER